MNMDLDLVLRARRIVLPAGETSGCVGVRAGSVAAVAPVLEAGRVVTLADDEVLLPGLVDTHVHVNDPGRSEWEGFASATRAAAAGGVTTIVDMPLNSVPPTVDAAALSVKREAAAGHCFVDVGFWGGAVPANLGRLRALHDAGVFGFKCFVLPSGVEEFPPLSQAGVEAAMREIAGFDGLLLVHAEDESRIGPAPPSPAYRDFLASRPEAAEVSAVAELVALARRTGCRVHVVHVSAADVLPLLDGARRDGVRVGAETCPHYLFFDAEEVPDGATELKCCPPIRSRANREALWEGLRAGILDLVVSDHSPSTTDLKCTGDFGSAWGGISSLQLGLSAVWTRARAHGCPLVDVARWMSAAPARQVGLARKGGIEVGRDADLCAFAPDDSFTVRASDLQHKNPVTAYDGHRLTGIVRRTWLRGREVDVHAPPHGRLLSRGDPE